MNNNKFLTLLFPMIALILEILPNAVAMRCLTPQGELTYTSYFDLLSL